MLNYSMTIKCLLYSVYFLHTVTCGDPPDVLHSSHTFTGVNVGDIITYTCDGGYAISGRSYNTTTAACGRDGNWAGVPSCVGKVILNKSYFVGLCNDFKFLAYTLIKTDR